MMKLTYKQVGDVMLPDLTLDDEEGMEEEPLGKYGLLRQTFLMDYHHGTYTAMLLDGRLMPHLREIDRQAREQVDRIVDSLKKQNGVDEKMKSRDQLGWVQAVNNFLAQAEEIVLTEIVYK